MYNPLKLERMLYISKSIQYKVKKLKCEVINIYTKSYDLGIPDKAGYPSWFLIKI